MREYIVDLLGVRGQAIQYRRIRYQRNDRCTHLARLVRLALKKGEWEERTYYGDVISVLRAEGQNGDDWFQSGDVVYIGAIER